MRPDDVIGAYDLALRHLYGEEIANATEIYHSRGWYYLNLAQRFPDGSIGAIGRANAYRKKQILAMAATLNGRYHDKTSAA